ncbi:hypothetical protein ABZW10_37275 [Kitasatospora sp. NPDC004723]|uniref:hypothetical protein n=1 Tax=Kitasatospora sp. NPDC004723 TaxID=3154288 RepID=UPI0033BDA50D
MTPPVIDAPKAPESGRAGMTGLPLSAYQADDEASVKEVRVRNALVVSCMRRAGYTGFGGDGLQEARPPDNATALPAGAWGYLGAQAAGTQGFHAPRRNLPAVVTGPAAGAGEAYDAARVDCDRQAAERIGSPPGPGADLIGRLFADSMAATGRDGRVTAATARWAACMTAAGFRTDDPATFPDQFRTAAETTPAELAAARADADCTADSNLAGIWFTVLAGYQRQQIDRNGPALNAHREAVRAQDAKLTRLLAEGDAGPTP